MLLDAPRTPRPPHAQAKNSEMLVECFYALEDFDALGKLMEALPDGNLLLRSIGEKFQSVGLCNEGVAAFEKVVGMPPLALQCSGAVGFAAAGAAQHTQGLVPPCCCCCCRGCCCCEAGKACGMRTQSNRHLSTTPLDGAHLAAPLLSRFCRVHRCWPLCAGWRQQGRHRLLRAAQPVGPGRGPGPEA